MKKRAIIKFCLLLFCLFTFGDFGFSQNSVLIWNDEFQNKGLPDSSKWDYEQGFVRNKELQYYTRARKQNAFVQGGMLIIKARKEKYANPGYDKNDDGWRKSRKYARYTSASLITLNKKSFRYGRIEIRAKLPQGNGVWPAIWMLGENRSKIGYPLCGEIDLMEFVGKEPDTIYGTVHYPVDSIRNLPNGGHIVVEKPSDKFHLYAIEWYPDRIDFFLDSIKYHSYKIDEIDSTFKRPFYLIINFALGGNWAGKIDDGIFPQAFYIDYVRYYRLREFE